MGNDINIERTTGIRSGRWFRMFWGTMVTKRYPASPMMRKTTRFLKVISHKPERLLMGKLR
jgi:hypothetical protein